MYQRNWTLLSKADFIDNNFEGYLMGLWNFVCNCVSYGSDGLEYPRCDVCMLPEVIFYPFVGDIFLQNFCFFQKHLFEYNLS